MLPVKCSSLFPRCSVAQAREEPSLIGGRVPMCLHLCILPLVMCPGFWMECVANHDTTDSRAFPADLCSFRDLRGDCSMVAMPPVCTQAYFQATWRLPPQFSEFDQVRRLSMTGCAVHWSKFRGACFASGPSFPRSLPASRFRPNSVAHTRLRVSNCNGVSRVWRSMTCLCQQEIHDRLLFPMQHVRKTSPHAGQRPSDR